MVKGDDTFACPLTLHGSLFYATTYCRDSTLPELRGISALGRKLDSGYERRDLSVGPERWLRHAPSLDQFQWLRCGLIEKNHWAEGIIERFLFLLINTLGFKWGVVCARHLSRIDSSFHNNRTPVQFANDKTWVYPGMTVAWVDSADKITLNKLPLEIFCCFFLFVEDKWQGGLIILEL
jgi:hypothetical protein